MSVRDETLRDIRKMRENVCVYQYVCVCDCDNACVTVYDTLTLSGTVYVFIDIFVLLCLSWFVITRMKVF